MQPLPIDLGARDKGRGERRRVDCGRVRHRRRPDEGLARHAPKADAVLVSPQAAPKRRDRIRCGMRDKGETLGHGRAPGLERKGDILQTAPVRLEMTLQIVEQIGDDPVEGVGAFRGKHDDDRRWITCVFAGAGYSSSTTCALAPLKPKLLTAARRAACASTSQFRRLSFT